MSKKNPPNIALLVVISLVILAIIGFLMIQSSGGNTDISTPSGTTSNVAVRDGIQYITIDAKGGYKPRNTTAKGGIPTKLIMKTQNTYDCSASLVIPKANIREVLPDNGTKEIDLGTPKSGDKIPGTCSMGMYNFSLTFN